MVVSDLKNTFTEGFHPSPKPAVAMRSKPRPLETSCGFILLNFDSILLLQYPQGHWSFPKGHVEKTDSDHHSTALRELTEETGISEVSIDKSWCEKTEYTFVSRGRKTPKQVYWYLAETDEIAVNLSHEHTNYLWLQLDDAEEQITFEQEKNLLRSARKHLRSSGRNL
jgi:bis(5'-nucleosidyl)-tetraphosphatase